MTTYFADEKNVLSEKLKETAQALNTVSETYESLTEMKANIIDEREGLDDNAPKGNALDDLLTDVDAVLNSLQGVYDGYSTSEFNNLNLLDEEEVESRILGKTL